jgi:hypothetical protein
VVGEALADGAAHAGAGSRHDGDASHVPPCSEKAVL